MAVVVAVVAVTLSGCGGGNNTGQAPAVTVTTTPTVTVTLARPGPTVAATTTGNPKSSAKLTHRTPVAPGATLTYAHCLDIDKPARRESSTLKEFTRMQDPENLVLLTLDSRGRATRARNDPAC